MMKQILIIMLLFTVMLYDISFPQVHITQIKIGDKFPGKISLGGYKEVKSKNCDSNCKVYLINYNIPVSNYGTIVEFLQIYYSKDNIVFGIKKAEVRTSLLDALYEYIGRLSHFIRGKEIIKDWKLLTVRDTGRGGVVDDIYYYKYLITSENTYNTVGLLEGNLIEEHYLRDSEYKSVFKN